MNGPALGALSLVLLLGSTAAGWFGVARFPAALALPAAREAVRRITGIVALLAAIMLGFGIVAQESTFRDAQQSVNRLAHEITGLDTALLRLGPQGAALRRLLFRYAAVLVRDDFPDLDAPLIGEPENAGSLQDALEDSLEHLVGPGSPTHSQVETLALLHEMAQTRWAMDSHLDTSVQEWQLAALVVWTMLAFAGMGVLVPRTRAMAGVLTVGAVAMAGAVFLLAEFSDPFRGVITVSGAPLLEALRALADR